MTYATSLDLTADVIHVSDLIARIEELNGRPSGELDLLHVIMHALCDVGGGDEKWEGNWYPAYLVADHYFANYAREMLEDCGTIPKDLPSWVEIDWDATARNVRMDYTPVEVNGRTYWTR